MTESVQRDVTASGIRLRVADTGEGPAVLLLHGLFVDHTAWSGVTSHLSRRFRVVAPDLPGFGQSEKPPPNRFAYDISSFAEAVADLYAGLSLGRAALVGHGLGGAVALTVAARHPELVSRLVLIDTPCYPAAPIFESRVALLPFVGSLVFKQLLGRPGFGTLFRDRLLGPQAQISAERIAHYYQAFSAPAARGSVLATLRATVDLRPLQAQTTRVKTPTLVLWGRHDRLYPPAFGQRLAREIRGAGFELLDAGHSPHEELPLQIATVITQFLSDRRPSLA